MKKFTISKEVKHTVWYRYYYDIDATTKEEAIKKFNEAEEDVDGYLSEAELLWDTLEEVIEQDNPPYHEIDGEYFEV